MTFLLAMVTFELEGSDSSSLSSLAAGVSGTLSGVITFGSVVDPSGAPGFIMIGALVAVGSFAALSLSVFAASCMSLSSACASAGVGIAAVLAGVSVVTNPSFVAPVVASAASAAGGGVSPFVSLVAPATKLSICAFTSCSSFDAGSASLFASSSAALVASFPAPAGSGAGSNGSGIGAGATAVAEESVVVVGSGAGAGVAAGAAAGSVGGA